MGGFQKILLLVLTMCWLGCDPALAEKQVALVLGNSLYRNVPKLTNPTNDAAAIARMLKSASFDVETGLDLPIDELRRKLRDFGNKSRDAEVAVVYYAGHGMEMDGTNYLIPVDATLETDADVLDQALPLDRVLFAVNPAKKLRLIILDACRDNPFAQTMKRTVASRGIGRGLAKVEPTTPNTMIAYAAKAGSTASDGDSKNSPFATALIEYLPKPGLDLRRALGFVRDDVLKNTGNKQEPYVYGSLGGDDTPLVPGQLTAAEPRPNAQDTVRKDYELAAQLGTRDGWNAFLAQYSEGFYANLAKGQLSKIAAETARAAAAEKARLVEQETARTRIEKSGSDKKDQIAALAPPPANNLNAAKQDGSLAPQSRGPSQFTEEDARRISALGTELNLKMPAFTIAATQADSPSPYAKFVGVWSNKRGWGNGKGRHGMLIITEVSATGLARGYYLWGPSTKYSWQQSPAGYVQFAEPIENDTFSFKTGDTISATLGKNVMTLVSIRQDKPSERGSIELRPIWQLSAPARDTTRPTGDLGQMPQKNASANPSPGEGKQLDTKPRGARSEPATKSTATEESSAGGESGCNRMHHKAACLCAIRNGGSFSSDGKHWLHARVGTPAWDAYIQCQVRAGIQ
jgi:uncharacterized caspase-like protein